MLKRIVEIIKHPGSLLYPNTYSQERYQEYLRSHGVNIGKNTRFINPGKCSIDINRGDYISIGENCCLSVVTILAHDYSWYTFLDAHNDVVPDPGGEVIIGNNCFIGYQACILKDTHIGNNVIIGARSVVKGNIPSNTVWAGSPAKMICTLEDFYVRKADLKVESAVLRRDHVRSIYQRDPSISEMGLFAVLFLERNNDNYEKYIKEVEINGIKNHEKLKEFFFSTQPLFKDFNSFLNYKN